MPGMDGSGPAGRGPMTGRGRGQCGSYSTGSRPLRGEVTPNMKASPVSETGGSNRRSGFFSLIARTSYSLLGDIVYNLLRQYSSNRDSRRGQRGRW